jgi:HrpA-like RNA helicase
MLFIDLSFFSGFYYQLISAQTKAKLLSHGIPEICRCALDSAILSMLYIGVEDGKGSFFKTLLDPPPQDSIDASFHSLFKLKAAEALPNGCIQLTPLGVHLAGIPAPPVVGKCKYIIFSYILSKFLTLLY